MAEKKISDLENMSMETPKIEMSREKRICDKIQKLEQFRKAFVQNLCMKYKMIGNRKKYEVIVADNFPWQSPNYGSRKYKEHKIGQMSKSLYLGMSYLN